MKKAFLFYAAIATFISVGSALSQQAKLTGKLDSLVKKYDIAGLSVSVAKDSKIVYTQGFGKRDIGRNLPVNDSTKFRIASISKFFTSIAVMQLYEQGKLKLDEDVSRYLGYTFRNPKYPSDSITLRRILSHTAGIRDGDTYSDFLSATASSVTLSIKDLLVPGGKYYSASMWSDNNSAKLNYFTYSNVNFGVAGTIVEKISGERFDIYCRKHIFAPLGLTCSYNIQDLPDINNLAVLYRKPNGVWTAQYDQYNGVKPTPRNLSGYVPGTNGFIFGPQGGLRVSSSDLAIVDIAIMNGGILNGNRILNDTTVLGFLKSNWIFSGGNGDTMGGEFKEYAFGNHRTTDLIHGEVLYGHPGEAYGLISDMYFSKDNSFAITMAISGGTWGSGKYSAWYNVEEDIYQACYAELNNLVTGVDKGDLILPGKYELKQNYPNPFNPTSKIDFSLPKDSHVTIKVYNSIGREVSTLINAEIKKGEHQAVVDGSLLSSGVYFYNIKADGFCQTRKMVVLK